MTVTITIETDNAAFEHMPGREVSRILKRLAGMFNEHGVLACDGTKLMDINGNKVGNVEVAA